MTDGETSGDRRPPRQSTSSSSNSRVSGEIGHKPHGFPNPPDATNPDPATLREQWRFAIRQYSRWYSHAWGTAILAGLSFFALGWFIKGSNPLPSLVKTHDQPDPEQQPGHDIPSPPALPPLTSSSADAHQSPKS